MKLAENLLNSLERSFDVIVIGMIPDEKIIEIFITFFLFTRFDVLSFHFYSFHFVELYDLFPQPSPHLPPQYSHLFAIYQLHDLVISEVSLRQFPQVI